MSHLRAASSRLNALPSCISLSATPYCLHIARICFCFAICRLLASAYRVWKASPSPCRGPKFAITSSSDSIAGHNAVVASLGSSSGDWGSVPSSIDCTSLSVSGIIELSPVCSVVGLVVVADSFLRALLWSGSRLPKVGSNKAMAIHALSGRNACIHIAVKMRHVIGGTCQSNNASRSEIRAIAMVAISWSKDPVDAQHQQ